MKETFETDYYSDILHYELGSHDSLNEEPPMLHLANREFLDEILRFNSSNTKKKLFTSFIPSTVSSGSNGSVVTQHKRRREEKAYLCHIAGCAKEYKSKENLNLHIKNKHEGLKPYQCSHCPLSFSHRNGKRYHERKQHTNYLPYPCLFCAHQFASNSAMKAHMKICKEAQTTN